MTIVNSDLSSIPKQQKNAETTKLRTQQHTASGEGFLEAATSKREKGMIIDLLSDTWQARRCWNNLKKIYLFGVGAVTQEANPRPVGASIPYGHQFQSWQLYF